MTYENNDLRFDRFKAALDEAIQRHAPIQKQYVQSSSKPSAFMNKHINKEIIEVTPQK